MKIAAIIGLVLALGTIAAAGFVLVEPIGALERLKAGEYGFSPEETAELIDGRYREASIPLIAGSIAGALALVLGVVGRKSKLGVIVIVVACLGLAACAYVWARYADGIIRAL